MDEDWADVHQISSDDVHDDAQDLGKPGQFRRALSIQSPIEAFEAFFPVTQWRLQGLIQRINQSIAEKEQRPFTITYGKWVWVGL